MLINWHAHIMPPSEQNSPTWQGKCPATLEKLLQINFGGIPTEQALRTIELFAREVMPAFPDAGASGSATPAAGVGTR